MVEHYLTLVYDTEDLYFMSNGLLACYSFFFPSCGIKLLLGLNRSVTDRNPTDCSSQLIHILQHHDRYLGKGEKL